MTKQHSRMTVLGGAALCLVVLGLVWASVWPQPVAAGFTPTPTRVPDTGGGGGGGGDSDRPDDPCQEGAIYGQVSDLCLGLPAAGVSVFINGSEIRTDWDGRFSLTGLRPGTYNLTIAVAGAWSPDEQVIEIFECGQVVTVAANYNSCLAPSPTPTVTLSAFFLPETGGAPAGSAALPAVGYAVGLLLLVAGLGFWGATRAKP